MALLALCIHSCCSPCHAPGEKQQRVLLRCLKTKRCFGWTQIQALIKKDVSSADIQLFIASGNHWTKYKDEKAKNQTCRVQFIFIYGNKTFFSPCLIIGIWKACSLHNTSLIYTVLLHTHCSSERCLWIQIYETNNTLNLVGKTHICTFLEFCHSGKCYRNVKGCLCSCALWFIAQR